MENSIWVGLCPIARLPDCPIARLPDCPIARLPDCPTAKRVAAAAAVFVLAALSAVLPTVRAQLIINGTHTITVDEGDSIEVTQEIVGQNNAILNINGAGQVTLKANSPLYQGEIVIRGAEFVNPSNGLMTNPKSVTVRNGGTLVWGTSTRPSRGAAFSDTSSLILSGGILRLFGSGRGERFEHLSLVGGANTIDIQHSNISNVDDPTEVYPTGSFTRGATATLHLTTNRRYSGVYYSYAPKTVRLRIPVRLDSPDLNTILPWATIYNPEGGGALLGSAYTQTTITPNTT